MIREQEGMIFDIQRWSLHDGPGIRTNVFLKGCPLTCLWCSNPESQSHSRELAFFRDKCIGCGTCIDQCPQQAITKGADGLAVDFHLCRTFCGTNKLAEQSFSCSRTCYARALDIMGRKVTAGEVMKEVLSDKPIYESSGGGITITGGEPFAQPEFLLALLRLAREEGLHTVIESCLYAAWEAIAPCLPDLDYLYLDLKILDEDKHKRLTGMSNKKILENIRKIYDYSGSKELTLVVRTPVIPGINDTSKEIGAMADWITRYLPGVTEYELLPYHRLGRGKYANIGKTYCLSALSPPPEVVMEELKAVVSQRGLKTK